MDKRETVIGHLGILRTWCAVNPKYGMALSVEDCDKAVGWLDDAIKLLKAQEPRVMMLEEVTEDMPDVVWFDDRHFVMTFAAIPKNENYHGWIKFVQRNGIERHDHIDGYGKEWRCWTSRPTDEQREATPWIS